MPVDILMPALSPTMEKGNLAKWLKNEGDKVKSGDIIAEIETDKATMEVEAVDEGVLAKILVPAGTQDVAVNTPIAVIAAEGEAVGDRSAAAPAPAATPVAAPSVAAPAVHVSAPADVHAYDASNEVPAGTEFVTQTMREALRDAMAEKCVAMKMSM